MADYGGAISLSQAGRDLSPTSDDDESDHSPRSIPTLSCGGAASKPRKSGDFSSPVDLPKKPRGRPPGSKNKPKPPIVITKDSDLAMKPVILEISAGADVVESVVQYARRRRVGITVLSGSGSVSTVTLRHPMSHAPALSLHGPFSLLSLSGSFVGSTSSSSPPPPSTTSSSSSKPSAAAAAAPPSCSSFGICLAGAQGQVFGGIVGGKVVAASLVVVVAATFLNPTFHRLPNEADHEGGAEDTKPCIGGGGGGNEGSSGSTAMSVSVYSVASPTPINCQLSPDVMPWGPTSRSPY